MRIKFAATGVIFACLAGPGLSQEFSASEVVNFLLRQVEPVATELCVGMPAECAAREQEAGFDVMVNFGFDDAVLTDGARSNLEEVALALNDERLSEARVVVEGHTDGHGPGDYNLALSERRAEAVAALLQEAEVEADRMSVLGLGETAPRMADPLDPNNRRVELRLDLRGG